MVAWLLKCKWMKTILSIYLFIVLTNAHSQNTVTAKSINPLRIYGDTILIFSGELLYFDAIIVNDHIIGFKEIKPIVVDSSNTIIIGLDEKNTDKIEDVQTILSIYNPFYKKLFYRVESKDRKKDGDFTYKGVLPATSKVITYGLWPDQAESVRIFNLTLK